MPELPEVETIVRGLREALTGLRIRAVHLRNSKIVRNSPALFRRSLTGARICAVRRQGKFILIDLESSRTLVIHLRMTGQLILVPERAPVDQHTHVLFDLTPEGRQLRYRDVRKFGRLEIQEPGWPLPHLTALAPDPFELSARELFLKLREKKRAIKPLLLDQNFLSGLGNIYVDESLYRSQIHPLTPANGLSEVQAGRLHRVIRRVLRQAILAKGTTVSDYRGPEGIIGGFQHFLRVYGCTGEPCRVCGTPIQKSRVGGRGTHSCPGCQSLPKLPPANQA
jgi:formamidopyrimidine-DNA glycosylase